MSDNKKIFLSHKGKDKQLVRDFKETLEALGYEPWLDEDAMVAGTSLQRGILQGMKDSCAVVFFITPSFKEEGFLESEIDYAITEKHSKGDKFSIIILQFIDDLGNKGLIPELLQHYVWKTPKTNLEALREIIRALPIIPSNFVLRKEVKNIAEVQYISPEISKEAELILIEASNDEQGLIIRCESFEGPDISTNRKSLIPDNKPRTIAQWEKGMKDLISFNLIEDTNGKSNKFKVTVKGYKVADDLKKVELYSSNIDIKNDNKINLIQ